MARQSRLRAVTEADLEAAQKTAEPPKTLEQAARDGDDIAELKAMRLRLAKALANPDTPARDLASLSRRQIEIGREIRSLEALAKQEAAEGDDKPAEDEEFDASAV